MMKILLLLAVAAVTCVTGCSSFYLDPGADPGPVVSVPVVHNDGVLRRAVVYGLDRVDPAAYQGWAGACPGTILDALRMRDLLIRRGYTVIVLTNSQATAFRVTSACVAAAQGMKTGDKLVVYGSSHGGQATDIKGDEGGGMDSTICLWDGQFVDDLVYRMLVKVPKGVDVVVVGLASINKGDAAAVGVPAGAHRDDHQVGVGTDLGGLLAVAISAR